MLSRRIFLFIENPKDAEALLKQQEQQSDRYNGRDNDQQVPRQLRQSRHRRPLPDHLPREMNRLEPAETCCPGCGSDMAYLSEVSAEQLGLVSSVLKVIRTVRVKRPAPDATASLKRLRHHAPSIGVSPGRVCWPAC